MKKNISFLSLLFVVLLVSFTNIDDKKIIIIDAGHGGHDNGATFENLTEKNIVEQIAKKIFEKNDASIVTIILLRDTDNYIPLQERIDKINSLKPNLVISLHVNNIKTNTTTSGVEAFVSEKNSNYIAAKEQAEKLLSAISNESLKSRGIKPANFMILKNSNCPSVVLELGFISNENDRKYITSEEGQNEIATNIVKSIQ